MSIGELIETIKTGLKKLLGRKVAAPAPKRGKKDKKKPGVKSTPKMKKETKGKKPSVAKTKKGL
jgi:hypothetical protein